MAKRKVETLTENEAQSLFREYGISISYPKLCAGIDAGVPWAISGEHGGKVYRTIFRKPLVEWLEALAVVA